MEWEVDASGHVVLRPLAGWGTSVIADTAVGVQLRLVPDERALTDGRREVAQVVMTTAQARELAEALRRTADAADRTAAAGWA